MGLDTEKLKYVVDSESTIEEAWSCIEVNKHRSVIVVNKNKVVGTLSDGDLRKAMLSGRILSTPIKEVMNTNFISITQKEKGRSEEIFKDKKIFLIPVVGTDMSLLDILVYG